MLLAPVSSGEHVDAHDLQLGREDRSCIRRPFVAGDGGRQDFALLKERRHESIADAAVLDALTHREDVRIRRLHAVVDDDAAIDVEAGFIRELDVRADSRGHHDEIGFENRAVVERDTLGAILADDRSRRAPQHHADAEVFHLARQVVAAIGIELALHERGHQVHDGHVTSAHLQTPRGFEAKQAAADDHGFDAGMRALEQLARVVERPEREHVLLVEAFDRRPERRTAGREKQRVVRHDAAVISSDGLQFRVDVGDADAEAQLDVVAQIPFERIQRDLVGRAFAGEDRRQQDPVVVDVRLVAEDRDVEALVVLQNLFDACNTGHAVADDYQFLHRDRSTRTAHCL